MSINRPLLAWLVMSIRTVTRVWKKLTCALSDQQEQGNDSELLAQLLCGQASQTCFTHTHTMLRGEILEPGFCMKIWERKNYFCKSSVKLQPNFLVVYYYLLDWLQMRRIRGGLKVFWTIFSDLVLKPGSSGKFWGESLWTSQQWTSQKTSQHTAQWSKILQSHLNAFISWQQKTSVKNIDGTAWDTDESIKDAQERKSHKKP